MLFATATLPLEPPRDGRQSERALAIQRGVGRLLRAGGMAMVTELPLASGRRADIVAVDGDGEVWIVEVKSSIEDFRADGKWPDYRRHCDRLFFATHADVPRDIFPADAGLIIADGYGADVLREAPEHRLAGSTRRALLLRFAHAAAARLHQLYDPGPGVVP
ncbi:MAG: MmcB family DNA repair protein [Bauldia sp.]|nr:MmcB family DNA repair protein [Bauldia sp.]